MVAIFFVESSFVFLFQKKHPQLKMLVGRLCVCWYVCRGEWFVSWLGGMCVSWLDGVLHGESV